MRMSFRTAMAVGLLMGAQSHAQTVTPSPGDLAAINNPGLFQNWKANRWYIASSETIAIAGLDALTTGGPQNGAGLVAPSHATLSNADSSKVATADASVSATSLSVAASADVRDLSSTLTAAWADSAVTYMTFMDGVGDLDVKIHIAGELHVVGQRIGTDPSRAGVATYALGSLSNGTDADYNALFASAGIDISVTGSAVMEQFAHWPSSAGNTTAPQHLATFGALANDGLQTRDVFVDHELQVAASGTTFDCPPGLNLEICGKRLYTVTVFVMAGAQNGARANLPAIDIVSLTLPAQASPLEFDVGQSIPVVTSTVPEPSTWWLLLAGLLPLTWLRGAHGRRAGCRQA